MYLLSPDLNSRDSRRSKEEISLQILLTQIALTLPLFGHTNLTTDVELLKSDSEKAVI